MIGLAETGSGKTGAFGLPIMHKLLEKPSRLFGTVLAPTRELAVQIHEVFDALGKAIGLRCVCIVGGVEVAQQALALAKQPHCVIATPGRLVDHLENTKGFHLRGCKCLVMDEADRMLSMDFERPNSMRSAKRSHPREKFDAIQRDDDVEAREAPARVAA